MERLLRLTSSYDPLTSVDRIITIRFTVESITRGPVHARGGSTCCIIVIQSPYRNFHSGRSPSIASFGQRGPALRASSNLLNTASILGRPLHSTFQQLSRVFQSESVNPTSGWAGSFPPINSSTAIHSPRLGKGLCPQMTYSSFISGTATKQERPYPPRR